jgi:hypothetical protein
MLVKSTYFLVFAQALIFLVANPSCALNDRETRLIKEGNVLIGKIELFKRDQGRLPDSLSEIGIEEKEEGPLYYEKKSNTKYVLWFGTELGESIVYDSDHKKWNGPPS